MTMHYNNKTMYVITAKEIIGGWNYHNKELPPAYAITSAGDRTAMFCWDYLEQIKEGKAPTIEKYCDFFKKKKIAYDRIISLLKEVVELSELKVVDQVHS